MRWSWFAGVLLAASWSAGCSFAYTPDPNREFEPIPEFSTTQPIALVNAQPQTEEVNIGGVRADYHAWTDVAIQIAERELKKRGARIDAKSPRQLKLAVTRADKDTGFVTIATEIDLRVETGDGLIASYTGRNSSAMAANLRRQIDGAMMRVVVEMLKDPRIVAYVRN